jgi:flagellar motility protein MotE (MotC chaperone)
MHSDGDGRRGAATLLLYTLTFGLSAAVCATAKEPDASDSAERYGIDPARLDTASTESRALFAEVLDRLETLRGEVDGLTADKVALAERVRRLEDKGCETWAEAKESIVQELK